MITLELNEHRNVHDIQLWLEDNVGWIIDYEIIDYDGKGHFKGIGWTMKVIQFGKYHYEIVLELEDAKMESWFLMRWL